jgi:hypothetical protein
MGKRDIFSGTHWYKLWDPRGQVVSSDCLDTFLGLEAKRPNFLVRLIAQLLFISWSGKMDQNSEMEDITFENLPSDVIMLISWYLPQDVLTLYALGVIFYPPFESINFVATSKLGLSFFQISI